ncbi:MAG: DUF805 domain-containing protein [Bacteroidales bacterium]|nr:DUF805 domain-containing protein [Bacteroidales bacterium]
MNWYLKCLKQYADFGGRARRTEYWMFALFNILISLVFFVLNLLSKGSSVISVLSIIYSLAVFIPGLAVAVRRLHDIGKSGWNYLFILIPVIGVILMLIWFCTEGEHGSNAWGEDPKAHAI